jgi:hypothetical protein
VRATTPPFCARVPHHYFWCLSVFGRNLQCKPVRGVNSREECHWSHACKSFKRTCVGCNGILECKFLSEMRTVPDGAVPPSSLITTRSPNRDPVFPSSSGRPLDFFDLWVEPIASGRPICAACFGFDFGNHVHRGQMYARFCISIAWPSASLTPTQLPCLQRLDTIYSVNR